MFCPPQETKAVKLLFKRSKEMRNILLCVTFSLSVLFAACDIPIDLRQKNFAWHDYPIEKYDSHAKAYYHAEGFDYWAIVQHTGLGQLGGNDDIVLLCVEKKSSTSRIQYEVRGGIAVWTWRLGEPHNQITRLRILNLMKLDIERDWMSNLHLRYQGHVTGKANYDTGIDRSWLNFDVIAKKDSKLLKSMLTELYPLLKEEPYAVEIVNRLEPLMQLKE